jgi:PAS domain-containing protein
MSATPFQLDSACLPIYRPAAFEHTIIDYIQDLLLVLSPDGHVLHASQMCLALTTLTPGHLLGKHITTFMHYDDLPVFLEDADANMLGGRP